MVVRIIEHMFRSYQYVVHPTARQGRALEHLLGEIRRQKSLHGWKVKTPVHVVFEGDKEKLAIVRLVEHDIRAAVTAVSLTFRSGPSFAVIVEAAEVAAPTPEPRPAVGVRPNPARSTARTRPRLASPGATKAQFRFEPPRPCKHKNTGPSTGPVHSR